MKYLLLLAIFAVVAFTIYLRLRPYIRGVRRFLGVMREVNRMSTGARTDLKANSPTEKNLREHQARN